MVSPRGFDAMRWAATVPLKTAHKVVLMVLAARCNDACQCWPGLPTIAADTGLSERSAWSAVAELVKAGLISREVKGWRGTLYTLLVPDNLATDATLPEEQSGTPCEVPPANLANPASNLANPETNLANDVSNLATIASKPILEPKKEPVERKSRAVALVEPDGFEEWWKAYPRKEAKPKGKAAYIAALKRGATPADLMAGLLRFPFGDPKFIPHPASWLNAERYADEAPQSARGDPRFTESPAEKRHREMNERMLARSREPDPTMETLFATPLRIIG